MNEFVQALFLLYASQSPQHLERAIQAVVEVQCESHPETCRKPEVETPSALAPVPTVSSEGILDLDAIEAEDLSEQDADRSW